MSEAFAKRRLRKSKTVLRLERLEPRRLLSIQATSLGTDNHDWVGVGPSVGPDGFQDVHIAITGIQPYNASFTPNTVDDYLPTFTAKVSLPAGGQTVNWQYGNNPLGYNNAEIFFQRQSDGTVSLSTLLQGTSYTLTQGSTTVTGNGSNLPVGNFGDSKSGWNQYVYVVFPISSNGDGIIYQVDSVSSSGSTQTITLDHAYGGAPATARSAYTGTLTADLFISPVPGMTDGTQGTLTLSYFGNPGNTPAYDTTGFTLAGNVSPRAEDYTDTNVFPTQTAILTQPLTQIPATMGATQDSSGYSHISVPSLGGSSYSAITSVTLSDEAGTVWNWPPTSGDPWSLNLSPVSGNSGAADVAFEPDRNELNSEMSLRIQFANGTTGVTQFPGATSSPLKWGGSVNTSNVMKISPTNNPQDFQTDLDALGNGVLELNSGTYVINYELKLKSPVIIEPAPGATPVLTFVQPQGSTWTNAIDVTSSHTTLTGFKINFAPQPNVPLSTADLPWSSDSDTTHHYYHWSGDSAVIGTTVPGPLTDINIIGMNLQGPPSDGLTEGGATAQGQFTTQPVAGTYGTGAIKLLNMGQYTDGSITGNTLQGGASSLSSGPWTVIENTYVGPEPDTWAEAAFMFGAPHDLVVEDNSLNSQGTDSSPPTAGRDFRFFTMKGSSYNGVIEGNTVKSNIGVRSTEQYLLNGVPQGFPYNDPEIMLTESNYQAEFEGSPPGVYQNGFVLWIPTQQISTGSQAYSLNDGRGLPIGAGDVVSILSGPLTGSWVRIAQVLNPTTFLLDSPLPTVPSALQPFLSGTASVTNGSNTVTITGSSVSSSLDGNYISFSGDVSSLGGDSKTYQITGVNTATNQLTLSIPFKGPTAQGLYMSLNPYSISVTEGYTNFVYERNLISMPVQGSGSNATQPFGGPTVKQGGLVLGGSQFGTEALNNHFIGGNGGVVLEAGVTNAGYGSGTLINPAPDRWTYTPVFGAIIDQNTIEDSLNGVTVESVPLARATLGRTYITSSINRNEILLDQYFLKNNGSNQSIVPPGILKPNAGIGDNYLRGYQDSNNLYPNLSTNLVDRQLTFGDARVYSVQGVTLPPSTDAITLYQPFESGLNSGAVLSAATIPTRTITIGDPDLSTGATITIVDPITGNAQVYSLTPDPNSTLVSAQGDWLDLVGTGSQMPSPMTVYAAVVNNDSGSLPTTPGQSTGQVISPGQTAPWVETPITDPDIWRTATSAPATSQDYTYKNASGVVLPAPLAYMVGQGNTAYVPTSVENTSYATPGGTASSSPSFYQAQDMHIALSGLQNLAIQGIALSSPDGNQYYTYVNPLYSTPSGMSVSPNVIYVVRSTSSGLSPNADLYFQLFNASSYGFFNNGSFEYRMSIFYTDGSSLALSAHAATGNPLNPYVPTPLSVVSVEAVEPGSGGGTATVINIVPGMTLRSLPSGTQFVVDFNQPLAGFTDNNTIGAGSSSNALAVALTPFDMNGLVNPYGFSLDSTLTYSSIMRIPLNQQTQKAYPPGPASESELVFTPVVPVNTNHYRLSVPGYLFYAANSLSAGSQGPASEFDLDFDINNVPVDSTPPAVTLIQTWVGSNTIYNYSYTNPQINNGSTYQFDALAIVFNKPMDPYTINTTSIQLLEHDSTHSGGTVMMDQSNLPEWTIAYNPGVMTAYVIPTVPLLPYSSSSNFTWYSLTISGGSSSGAVTDDQSFPNPGTPIAKTLTPSFSFKDSPYPSSAPLAVDTSQGNKETMPTANQTWGPNNSPPNPPIGYATITMTEPVAQSSLGPNMSDPTALTNSQFSVTQNSPVVTYSGTAPYLMPYSLLIFASANGGDGRVYRVYSVDGSKNTIYLTSDYLGPTDSSVTASTGALQSATLTPAAGGLTSGLDGESDLPLNGVVASNPSTNRLVIVPTVTMGNDNYLFTLTMPMRDQNQNPLTITPSGQAADWIAFTLASMSATDGSQAGVGNLAVQASGASASLDVRPAVLAQAVPSERLMVPISHPDTNGPVSLQAGMAGRAPTGSPQSPSPAPNRSVFTSRQAYVRRPAQPVPADIVDRIFTDQESSPLPVKERIPGSMEQILLGELRTWRIGRGRRKI